MHACVSRCDFVDHSGLGACTASTSRAPGAISGKPNVNKGWGAGRAAACFSAGFSRIAQWYLVRLADYGS